MIRCEGGSALVRLGGLWVLLVQVSAMGLHLGKGAEAMKDEMERRREGFETVVG